MSASISLVDLGGGLIRQIDPSLNGDNELLVRNRSCFMAEVFIHV